MATKKITIIAPPSTTPQSIDVTMTVPDPVLSETHVITGTTDPIPPSPVNSIPTVNAGQDLTITLPTASVVLSGAATDTDGSITNYQWVKKSGPAATIQSPTAAQTIASGLSAGTYVFTLTVTDNAGAVKSDDVQVVVNPAIIVVPPGTRKNLLLESDWESGLGGWDITQQIGTPYGAGVSSEQAFSGTKSMRIELRRGDPLVSSSARAEIQHDSFGSNSANSEGWFGFAMFIPTGWAQGNYPESPIQFHQTPNYTGSEPVGLWLSNGKFTVMVTKGLNVGNTYIYGPAPTPGKWHEIVMHIKWDSGTNGFIQAWINGVQFADYKGVTNYPNQSYYGKLGCYRWYWDTASNKDTVSSRIYYFDVFRIGSAAASYNDVAPTQK